MRSNIWVTNGEEHYEYGADGKITKKITKDFSQSGSIIATVTEEYDSEGRAIHTLTERSGSTSELFITYNENSQILNREYYSNGVLWEHLKQEFNEEGKLIYRYDLYNKTVLTETFYNSMGLETEEIFSDNGVVTVRSVYEYYDDGDMKAEFTYNYGKLMEETHYDENGRITSNIRYDENGNVKN